MNEKYIEKYLRENFEIKISNTINESYIRKHLPSVRISNITENDLRRIIALYER